MDQAQYPCKVILVIEWLLGQVGLGGRCGDSSKEDKGFRRGKSDGGW